MKQTLEEACLKVAIWWADNSFRKVAHHDNGDDSNLGGMVFAMKTMASQKALQLVTEEKITKFENKLVELMLAENSNYSRCLDVDYGPCENLMKLARFAELSSDSFPIKSSTSIDEENQVWAKRGYGKDHVKI